MSNHSQKLIFLAVIVGAMLASRVAYTTFYPASPNNSVLGSGASTSSLAAEAPLLSLPAGASSSSNADSLNGAIGSGEGSNGGAVGQNVTISTSFGPGTTAPFAEIGHASPPQVEDEASLIADLTTGDIFLSANGANRWPLASITKLMTASIVMDNLDPNQKITVASEAVAVDPSQTILNVGDTYTVSDLLRVLLLPSSNVAAETLADYYGRARFLAAMNARAEGWGMTNTHYDDPSGLSSGNESTPDDLLILAQKIYADYPQILAITRTPQVAITERTTGKTVIVKSINNFAGRADFIGGKTGYTDEASGNLLSIFNYEKRPVLVVVMGTNDEDRFNNTLLLYNWFTANFK